MAQFAGQMQPGSGSDGAEWCDANGRLVLVAQYPDYHRRVGALLGATGMSMRLPICPGWCIRMIDAPDAPDLAGDETVGNLPAAVQLHVMSPVYYGSSAQAPTVDVPLIGTVSVADAECEAALVTDGINMFEPLTVSGTSVSGSMVVPLGGPFQIAYRMLAYPDVIQLTAPFRTVAQQQAITFDHVPATIPLGEFSFSGTCDKDDAQLVGYVWSPAPVQSDPYPVMRQPGRWQFNASLDVVEQGMYAEVVGADTIDTAKSAPFSVYDPEPTGPTGTGTGTGTGPATGSTGTGPTGAGVLRLPAAQPNDRWVTPPEPEPEDGELDLDDEDGTSTDPEADPEPEPTPPRRPRRR